MGQPHKPAEIVTEGVVATTQPAPAAKASEVPATHAAPPANDVDDAPALSATVTSLDTTRLKRMADIASHTPQAMAM
jgi:hypothetical protein